MFSLVGLHVSPIFEFFLQLS